ncbi:TfdA family Taurine catabolism dioxygenase TauD [Colletotrichum salicis]|uniref:TfdA family Taurine catabolism dioxygenase TauD n=1 Tax=Colletotrichum salicis TaxID=1209931 RepID=A0A135RPP1_9PEZI|nr:TfdA family Taurine catabolism dioxygenase TauD [Colletotrichum salicis]
MFKGNAFDHGMTRRALTNFRSLGGWWRRACAMVFINVLDSARRKAYPWLSKHPSFVAPRVHASAEHRIPVLSDDLAENLRDGITRTVPGVKEVTGPKSVTFTDGTVLDDIDAIIICTGYEYDFSVIKGAGDPTNPAKAPDHFEHVNTTRYKDPHVHFARLYGGFLSKEYPESLAFIGHFFILKAPFAFNDLVTMALASLWSGKVLLPSADVMAQDINRHYDTVVNTLERGVLPHLGFRMFGSDTYTWLNKVAGTGVTERVGCFSKEAWMLWWNDRKFYNLLMDGADSPAVYRLFETERGRKAWPGARDQIPKTNKEVKEISEEWIKKNRAKSRPGISSIFGSIGQRSGASSTVTGHTYHTTCTTMATVTLTRPVQPDIQYAPDYQKFQARTARRVQEPDLPRSLPEGLPQKFTSDMVWEGANLASKYDWTYALTSEQLDELDAALAHFKAKLHPELRKLSYELHNGYGFFVVRGLRVDEHTREDNIIIYAGLSSHIAPQRGRQDRQYDGKPADVVLTHIKDLTLTKDKGQIGSPAYTADKQVFHTDAGDIVSLFALSTAAEGGTSKLASIARVYNEIASTRPDLIHTLTQDWQFEVFGKPEKSFTSRPLVHYQPATPTTPERLAVQYARRYFVGYGALPRSEEIPPISEAQAEALDTLHYLGEKFAVNLDFQKGDIQYANNIGIFHARDGFTDTQDQQYVIS